jgi:hypothetical protein
MLAQKRSVLDAVIENAKALQRGLAKNDKAKLDEYFQGIRDIETRLAKDEQWIGVPQPRRRRSRSRKGLAGEEIKIMYDIMIAAMQTDSTRVHDLSPAGRARCSRASASKCIRTT